MLRWSVNPSSDYEVEKKKDLGEKRGFYNSTGFNGKKPEESRRPTSGAAVVGQRRGSVAETKNVSFVLSCPW